MLPLHPDKIELWLAFCDEIADEGLLADYRRLLVEEERQKEARFHLAHDRHRYLITRALVRSVLSRYAAVAPQDWCFEEDAYGRPQIVNADPVARRITFNISHTRSLVVLGVTCERALGVDTEDFHTRQAELGIADHYFAADEVAQLRTTPPDLQQTRFFEYWTLKESYIKARGLGLKLPLHGFSFTFDPLRIAFHGIEDDPERWSFWQAPLAGAGGQHLCALCIGGPLGRVERVDVRL